MSDKIFRSAFTASLPVMMGYLSMGAAFGVLLTTHVPDFTTLHALFMSLTQVSGSMQFAAVEILHNSEMYSYLMVLMLVFLINIRYMAYGFPFIQLFKTYPWYVRWYLTFALTDETYAIMVQCKLTGREQMRYFLTVAMLDHSYWLCGTAVGAAAGKMITFDTTGIDFAMAALFMVILVDLCRDRRNLLYAFIGAACTLLTLLVCLQLCPAHMNKILLPAMILMVSVFLIFRKKLQPLLCKKSL